MRRTTRFARVIPAAFLVPALVWGSLWYSADVLAQSTGGGRSGSSQAVQGSSGVASTSKGSAQGVVSGFDPQAYISDGFSVVGPVKIRSANSESIAIVRYKNDLIIDLKGKKLTVLDSAGNMTISVDRLAPERQVYVCQRDDLVVVALLPELRKGSVER